MEMDCPDGSAVGEVAAQLKRTLEHVLEPGIRRTLVFECLTSLTPEAACGLMGQALRHPPRPSHGWQQLRELIHELLLSHPDGTPSGLPYPFRRRVYEEAARVGDAEVMRILRSTPQQEESEQAEQRLPVDLVDIPLGRRRSLAKGVDEQQLELLALDPDPVVVRNLLRNPRIRELEVLRMAALRPVSAQTLHEIAENPRWCRNLRVRTALARNPYCPTDLAAKLIAALPLAVLREMRGDPDLPPETKGALRRELEMRAPRTS